jgi:hypothetical protein
VTARSAHLIATGHTLIEADTRLACGIELTDHQARTYLALKAKIVAAIGWEHVRAQEWHDIAGCAPHLSLREVSERFEQLVKATLADDDVDAALDAMRRTAVGV